MRPRSIDDLLQADPGIARLATHTARLLRLQTVFAAAVPAALGRSAHIANLKQGKILIYSDNGAVAAKLRQLAPRLTDLLRSVAPEVTGIDIRVQATSGNSFHTSKRRPAGIGSQAKQGLTSLESSLPTGSRLQVALARLIARG